MNLDTYESMTTPKQNLDILVSEMIKQLMEVTKIISQNRIQQYTLEQISDSNVLSRDRPQRMLDVSVETNQDLTNETRNTGKGMDDNQMMTEEMIVDKGELSRERECDMSVLIKQICTESDVMSQCVLCLSGLQRMLECCIGLSGTLQSVTDALPEKGTSDSDLRESHHNETVGILKQLIEESRVALQTLERLEDELFKGEDAQFVKMKGLITRLIIRLRAEVNCISDYNEETSKIDEKKENPEVDNMCSSTMFTSPGVIDEAVFVSMILTLDESENMETDRAKLQGTLEGMYDPKGINIHEDTLEKPKIDTAKGPNSVDSKGLNCQDCKMRVHINKQSPDIAEDVADDVHVDKGDFDDLIVQVPQAQIVEKTIEIPQMQTVEKIAGEETSSLRQSAGILQADEKQLENDVSGRVSESRKCFQLVTQFRDTSSEHSTPEHCTQSTHIEHYHRDSTCTTTITDDELINDDGCKMEKGEQGGGRAIHARYGNRMQAMTEKELRRLMEENSGKYVVYDGKIMTPGSIKQLKNHTIVRIVDRMMGEGKKKGQKKQNKEETTRSSESDALQDMFMSLMKQDDDKGNSMFRTMMQLDDEMVQEAMNNMRQAFDENSKKFGMEKLSFEAVERLIYENRNSAQQAIKAQQEKATQKAERREEEEVRRFKEDQKQIMIEKERQARENEREKREQETMMSNERGRPAVQAHDEREAEKQQEMNMKEIKIRFGRYHGKDCETIYQEDRNYCQWV